MRLLLVEHHRPLVRAFQQQLQEEGIVVDVAYDGSEANRQVASAEYDVIILDLMSPQNDGLSLLEKWGADKVRARIILLTGGDKFTELDLDTYNQLVKPFEFEELLALVRPMIDPSERHDMKTSRVSSAADRSGIDPVLQINDLMIDTSQHSVQRGGKELRLTPREYSLLEFLALHRGKVVTRSMIWRHLYHESDEKMSNVIDVYIRYLRKKIDKGFDTPLIRTRWGIGYMLAEAGSKARVTS